VTSVPNGTLVAISLCNNEEVFMQPLDQKERSTRKGIKLNFGVTGSTFAICILASSALVGARDSCSGPDTIHRPYTFTYVKSGGFAGVYEKLVVDSTAKQLTFQLRTGELQTAEATESDLLELEDKLTQADFMNIHALYKCSGCADQFVYEATLEMEGVEAHKVHWEDSSGAPAELTAVGELSESWIWEKFGPTPPSPWLPAAAVAR
jgi:hypothetical protein